MLSRAIAAAAAKQRACALAALPKQQLSVARSFSAEPKRPKAVKVKKSDARRRVEPKPEPPPQNALAETHDAPPPSPFVDQQQQQQPTFGQVMKANFLFGIGMALAFSIVGGIIASMEETSEPGTFGASDVTAAASDADELK